MNNEITYNSSKNAFQQGQFQRSASLSQKIIESNVSNETKIIMKANYFFALLLYNQSDLKIDEAQSMASLLLGIQDENLRTSSYNAFLTNLCLYEMSKKKYESALKIIEKLATDNSDPTINDIYGSISLCQNIQPGNMSPFLSIWHNYLIKKSDSILKCVGEVYGSNYIPFLTGYAFFQNNNYSKAIDFFEISLSNKYRISESLNYAGICCFYLDRIKDSVNYFERAIRMKSPSISFSLFNLAEVCGVLGRKNEQLSLLKFYHRLQKVHQEGSISTLYLLARVTLENKDYDSASKQYSDLLYKITIEGIDPPSPHFIAEYSFILNMKGEFDSALGNLPPERAKSDFERLVVAHSLWLSGQYEECDKMISKFDDGFDILCNKALLSFISGDDRTAMRQINAARKKAPHDSRVTRNAVLFQLARQQTVKSGCAMWLSSLGYQRDHQPEFYEDLINQMKTSNNEDQLTLCVLENWKIFQRKKI